MTDKDLKRKITGGLIWTFGERITAQLVSTIVTIVLARVLDPAHYGIISIVMVFITICNVFVISGMGSAIVQKKEVDDLDYNTAFTISFTMSLILYGVLFVTSPMIAQFYEMAELSPVIRVMGLQLLIAAINTIQQAHVQRGMAFRRFFVATLFATAVSSVVGIWMALNGFGVWALVGQYLTNTTIGTIVLFFVNRWIPKLQFSLERAKSIFSFGWKVLVTQLLSTMGDNIRVLVIGKMFGSADLAYYEQGKRYPALLVANINSAINKVMLPAYSQQQDNLPRLKQMLRRSISVGVFVLGPVLIGFAVMSDTFIKVVLTEKWVSASPYIKIFCIAHLTRPLESACHQALLAIGRSDKVLRVIFRINIFAFLTLLIATFVFHSVLLIAVGSLLTTFVSIGGFMWYANKLIGYSPKEQIQDVAPVLLISVIMGFGVYTIGLFNIKPILLLVLQVITGVGIYIGLSYVLKIEAFRYLIGFIRKGAKSDIPHSVNRISKDAI